MTDQTRDSESALTACAPISRQWLLAGLIAVVCIAVIAAHWPALSAQALSFDDDQYLVENQYVRNPGLKSAWRFLTEVMRPSSVAGYYQPLTMISLMLDYAAGGRPDYLLPFHCTSLLLHTANTALIIVLLYMLFGRAWIAAAVGLLFGVHPLTIEPIPWVSERKTLLAAFFVLLSLILYVRFTVKGQRKLLLWSLVMYVLALMSKPTSTPLPAMLLLLDFWPLRRLKFSCVWEKLPFFIVGGVFALITYISQSRTASVLTPQQYGLLRVPLVICHNVIFYLYKMVWPVNMSPFYPFPEPLNLTQPMILAGVIGTAVLISALLISLFRTRAAFTGWLIFFIMILPTMQAIQFSNVIASDKFAYLPSVGLLMVLAAFLGLICDKRRDFRIITAIVVLLAACTESLVTRKNLAYWRDSITLWTYVTDLTPNAASPRYNLGMALMEKDDIVGARREFETALKFSPGLTNAIYNIAGTYVLENRIDEAIERYNEVLKIIPGYARAYSALAYMYIKKGDSQHALELYHEGLKYNPLNDLLHGGLGSLLLQNGDVNEAIPEMETAVKIKPNAEIYCNLGAVFYSKGNTEKALDCYQKAAKLNPANAEAHYNLGNIYLEKNRLTAAVSAYDKAIKAKPGYVKAYSNMGVAFLQMELPDKAIEQFRRAIELEPNNLDARFNLANALADKGLLDESAENFRKVISLSPQDTIARLRLADLLLQKGQPEQAITEYEQVLKIDPNNSDARLGLQNVRDAISGGTPVNQSLIPRSSLVNSDSNL
ncbi:MAG: tetratricopeptide repeat protein [Sedimentisphaerales bacterium]